MKSGQHQLIGKIKPTIPKVINFESLAEEINRMIDIKMQNYLKQFDDMYLNTFEEKLFEIT